MRQGSHLLRLVLVLLIATTIVWIIGLQKRAPRRMVELKLGPGEGFSGLSRAVLQSETDSIVVEKRGDDYWITHPLSDKADPFFVSELRREAVGLRARRTLPDSGGGRFALDPPRQRVFLTDERGARWGLALGDSSPVTSQVYARKEGARQPVALIDAFPVRKYFTASLPSVRDPVPAPMRAGPVDSVSVLIPDRSLRARRESHERWTAREPEGLAVDPGRINAVVQVLRSPSILGYPGSSVSLRELGLDVPAATWVLFQGSRAETVRVGRPRPGLARIAILPSRRTGPAWLSNENERGLLDGWPAMADLHLITVPAESVKAVEFLAPAGAGAYVRADRGWIRQPSGHPVERLDALEQEVSNLTLLQWSRYPIPEPRPRSEARIALRVASPARAETLHLASPRDTSGLARSTRMRRWGPVQPLTWSIWSYRAAHPE